MQRKTRAAFATIATGAVLALFAVCLAASTFDMWPLDVGLHRYKSATSPDHGWSVTIYRRRTSILPFAPVDVFATVEMTDNHVSHRMYLYQLDMWHDIDDYYSDISCSNDRISIGPNDPLSGGYFILLRADTNTFDWGERARKMNVSS